MRVKKLLSPSRCDSCMFTAVCPQTDDNTHGSLCEAFSLHGAKIRLRTAAVMNM